MNFDTGEVFAKGLDQQDPIASMRDRFHVPPHEDGESAYLCGHSLGLQPRVERRAARRRVVPRRALVGDQLQVGRV